MKFIILFLFVVINFNMANAQCWAYVSKPSDNSFIIRNDGTLWGCGTNIASYNSGIYSCCFLGIEDTTIGYVLITPANTKTQIIGDYTQIGVDSDWLNVWGGNNSLAQKKDKSLWACGLNWTGGIGDGTYIDKREFVKISSDTDWKNIIYGGFINMGIKNNGKLWGWGDNRYGQFGIGNYNFFNVPTPLGTDSNWGSIAIGISTTYGIKKNGTLWACGDNNFGELGVGYITTNGYGSINTFTQIGVDSDWVLVSATGHTMAIKKDSSLWGWGVNYNECLGLISDTIHPIYSPVRVDSTYKYIWVETGGEFTIAMRADSSLWSWGYNGVGGFGLLGDTSFCNFQKNCQRSRNPVPLILPQKPLQIHAGYVSSVALLPDSTIWVWGWNEYGQMGLGLVVPNHYNPTYLVPGYNRYYPINANISCNIVKVPLNLNTTSIEGTLHVYPNPANNILIVEGLLPYQKETLKIYDVYGREITNIKTKTSNTKVEMDISNFSNGIYIIKYREQSIKFVKEN